VSTRDQDDWLIPSFNPEAEEILRAEAMIILEHWLRKQPLDLSKFSDVLLYIGARLLPVLERELMPKKGRPSPWPAGSMVQAYMNSGLDQVAARKLVQQQTGLKYASVAKAHSELVKKGAARKIVYTLPLPPR
jgi:hypothetical protein